MLYTGTNVWIVSPGLLAFEYSDYELWNFDKKRYLCTCILAFTGIKKNEAVTGTMFRTSVC